jgi:hypothetical protein
MTARALAEMKKRYPHIKCYLLLAYHPSVKQVDVPEGLDGSLLLDGQEDAPPRFAITRLNNQILKEVDYLIAYSQFVTDGSHKLLDTAQARAKKGKLVITNLAEQI